MPDYQDVFALLTDASSRSLFRTLWLRCGSDKSLLLNFTTAEMTRGDGLYVGWRILIMLSRLTNQPSRVAPRRRMRDVENVAEYVADPIVHSEWLPGESFEDAYRRFNESCERANVNARDVDFDEARARLVDSYETMVRSRYGGEDGSVRLGGSLALMVNDQWAVTFEATVMGIYGPQDGVHRLERLLDGQLYTTWPLVAADSGAAESCPEGYDTSYWEDALFYAQRFSPKGHTVRLVVAYEQPSASLMRRGQRLMVEAIEGGSRERMWRDPKHRGQSVALRQGLERIWPDSGTDSLGGWEPSRRRTGTRPCGGKHGQPTSTPVSPEPQRGAEDGSLMTGARRPARACPRNATNSRRPGSRNLDRRARRSRDRHSSALESRRRTRGPVGEIAYGPVDRYLDASLTDGLPRHQNIPEAVDKELLKRRVPDGWPLCHAAEPGEWGTREDHISRLCPWGGGWTASSRRGRHPRRRG